MIITLRQKQQGELVHSRATRIAPTPDVGLPKSACARTANLCVQFCVSGRLVWLDRVQHSRVSSGAGLNRNLLAQLGQRTRFLNRLRLSGRLPLSSVQLSCSLHIAFAAVPWAPAISFVANADTIC